MSLQSLDEGKTRAKDLKINFSALCNAVDSFYEKWKNYVRNTGLQIDEIVSTLETEIISLSTRLRQ